MLGNKELCELATDVLQETLYGPVPQNTAGELAAGVLALEKRCAHQETVFEELVVDRFVLAELRDFWRRRYKLHNLTQQGSQDDGLNERRK